MNRVWIFIISKKLNESDLTELLVSGRTFVSGWTAHENKLSASFEILKERIVLVRVNENVHNASGCSIDKLTRFIKESEQKFGVELLNRLLIAYQSSGGIEVVHASKIKDLLAQNLINENTIVYNTASASENDLLNWEQALKNTWLNKYLQKV
ncbi:MAG TPA: hypothetical protein PL029_08985 [Bacteroidia bacterium]|nr:hypothetical protein [Bacteroidia bacterium]